MRMRSSLHGAQRFGSRSGECTGTAQASSRRVATLEPRWQEQALDK
jgi:hypothetical protein